jgi:hypothetical protein
LIQTNVNFDRKIGDYFSNRSSARLNNNRPRPPAEVLRRRWHTDDHSPHRWSESTGEISAQQTETRNEKATQPLVPSLAGVVDIDRQGKQGLLQARQLTR